MERSNGNGQRAKQACNKLACLGFPGEKVKTALKRLMKLYNNQWEFIEEDNYRDLVDILMNENAEEPKEAKSNLNGVVCLDNEGKCKEPSSSSRDELASSPLGSSPGKRAKISHSRPELEKGKNPEFPEVAATLSQFEIASSTNEEVKVSLICSSSGNSYFRCQSLDVVLGEVEDECRKTYGIQDPNFSLKKLMKTVCQNFLEIDTDSTIVHASPICYVKEEPGGNAINTNGDCEGSSSTVKFCHSKEIVNHQKVINLGTNGESENASTVLEKPQHSHTLNMEAVVGKKYPIYLKDISRGEEDVPIPLVEDGRGALEWPDFVYIRSNMVHEAGHVDFSIARISDDNCCGQCLGDCLSSAITCACAGETGGEFAYTQEGLVKQSFIDDCIARYNDRERKYYYYCDICPLQNNLKKHGRRIKPCMGHLTRKFIKECWSKCGCNKQCGNRVVQRGIQEALQVFVAPEGKGWGLRSVHALKKGTFICEYVGEIVTNQELYYRNEERATAMDRHTYPVLLDADWGSERILKDEEALCLDATEYGNVGRFINHRCFDGNLIEIPVEVETPDHHYYRIAFFTSKDIEPMEELTWDYGIEFDDEFHPIKAFKCKCRSKLCRDKDRSSLIQID